MAYIVLIAGFLVALRIKGETAEELAGFARAMREKCVRIDVGPGLQDELIDIVGTGGDDAGTFNISTVAAIVLAGAGAKVAKHGNRAISGKVGSADVLEALGVRIALTPEEAIRAIREIGLGFLFAPHLHPAMRHVQTVRRELKMRTVFNLLGPLANPAGAPVQVIGAPSPGLAGIIAEALKILGTHHSYIVHGHDGTDELTSTTTSDVYEVTPDGVQKHVWAPEDFGLKRATLSALAGGEAIDNARIALDILHGTRSPRRDIVVLNSALGLLALGRAASPIDAVRQAAESIDSGRALVVLQKLQKIFPTR